MKGLVRFPLEVDYLCHLYNHKTSKIAIQGIRDKHTWSRQKQDAADDGHRDAIAGKDTGVKPYQDINTLRPGQNGRHFADDIFKWIFLNENVWIPIKISLEFVPHGQINNIPALVQIMAWRRQGDKPLFEPMMVRLPTQMCVTRPQWVKPTSALLCTPHMTTKYI